MTQTLHVRLACEAVGTLFLLMTVVGSGIMADRLSNGHEALALLGNTLPTGAILVVLIIMFGPFSGAHFNPAVSLVFYLQKTLTLKEFAAYSLVQCIGGLIGVMIAHGMFDETLFQMSQTVRTGPSQWLAEAVATFGLVAAIFITLKSRESAVAMVVGLYITAAYWFTASTSFANPAVTLARGFSDTFAGIQPYNIPAFIIAQLAGALVAFGFICWLERMASDEITTVEKQ
jgi:glycerol uptake facilitator-like aquaporin